jgi:hypothetical protein
LSDSEDGADKDATLEEVPEKAAEDTSADDRPAEEKLAEGVSSKTSAADQEASPNSPAVAEPAETPAEPSRESPLADQPKAEETPRDPSTIDAQEPFSFENGMDVGTPTSGSPAPTAHDLAPPAATTEPTEDSKENDAQPKEPSGQQNEMDASSTDEKVAQGETKLEDSQPDGKADVGTITNIADGEEKPDSEVVTDVKPGNTDTLEAQAVQADVEPEEEETDEVKIAAKRAKNQTWLEWEAVGITPTMAGPGL